MPRQTDPERSAEFVGSPLAWVAACFALGLVLARGEHSSPPGVPLLLGCGLCLLIGLMALRARMLTLSLLLALTGFVAAGATAGQLFAFRFLPNHVSHLAAQGVDLTGPIRLEAQVISAPFQTAYGLQFDVEVSGVESHGQERPAIGRLRLRLQSDERTEAAAAAGEALQLQYGDVIRAPVRLRRPHVYQNPGSFDFRRWMESIEDLYWVGTIKSPLLVEKLARPKSFQLARLTENARRRLLDAIDRLYPPWSVLGRNGAVLKAVLLGDRSSLDSDTVENFRKAGLYHLLVIAGLHVGILALLATLFLRLLGVGEPWRSLSLLLFLLGYASLVEQRAPTLRATVMITVYLLARLLYRQHRALNAVGIAALLLLLHRPGWVFESGFQLSFSAALLIVTLVAPILERTTEPYRRALRQLHNADLDPSLAPRQAQFRLDLRDLIKALKARVAFLEVHPRLNSALVTVPARILLGTASLLIFSAVLQLGLLLPMAYTFHRVSLAGVGLNALAIPLTTVLLALALPTVILGATLPALGLYLSKILAFIMAGVFAVTELPNLPAWLSYRVPEPPGWVAWGFALSVVVAAWTVGRRQGQAFWASAGTLSIFAILICLHPFPPRLPRGSLEITSLDCGGGEAVFVVLPDQTTLLIGGCGNPYGWSREGAFHPSRWDPGENVVSPYLWSRGVKQVDIVVLPGGRDGQSSGLPSVVRNFQVRELWQGPTTSTPAAEAFITELRRRPVSIRQVGAGDLITRGAASIQILWPPFRAGEPDGGASSRPAAKDESIILRIAHHEASALLSGDSSSTAQEELARSPSPSLQSRMLELAYRHAKSSLETGFFSRISPRVVVLAGGTGGLSNLLDGFRAAGARVFRTDLDGATTVAMNGTELSVRSYRTSAGEGTGDSSGSLTSSVR